jgi:hypothetical protein
MAASYYANGPSSAAPLAGGVTFVHKDEARRHSLFLLPRDAELRSGIRLMRLSDHAHHDRALNELAVSGGVMAEGMRVNKTDYGARFRACGKSSEGSHAASSDMQSRRTPDRASFSPPSRLEYLFVTWTDTGKGKAPPGGQRGFEDSLAGHE